MLLAISSTTRSNIPMWFEILKCYSRTFRISVRGACLVQVRHIRRVLIERITTRYVTYASSVNERFLIVNAVISSVNMTDS